MIPEHRQHVGVFEIEIDNPYNLWEKKSSKEYPCLHVTNLFLGFDVLKLNIPDLILSVDPMWRSMLLRS